MAVTELVESKSLYCPHCMGTHIHLYKKENEMWKCMACKQLNDGRSFHNAEEPTGYKAQG